MKKILIIINNFGIGGAERLVVDDANELIKRSDIDLKIITLRREYENSLSEQLNKNIKWEYISFGGLLDYKSYFLLYKSIKNFSPDILFTHLWFSNTIGRIVGKIVGVKKIISFEHNVYDILKTKSMFFVDWILQPLSYKIIAVSEAVKKSLLKYKISEEKVDVILNCIDISKYQNIDVVSLDGEEKKNFTFVFIGRLIYQKGVDILLKSFALINPGKLLIVGEGSEKESLIKLSKELKIDDRVKFLGMRKDIPEILAYADCFVLPSRYEGLPMVLLEAFVSKKIIIVSDFESAIEVIKSGENGIIVPKENVDKLSTAMSMVSRDMELGCLLIGNAKNDSKFFSIENHIQKLISYI